MCNIKQQHFEMNSFLFVLGHIKKPLYIIIQNVYHNPLCRRAVISPIRMVWNAIQMSEREVQTVLPLIKEVSVHSHECSAVRSCKMG